MSKSVLSPDGNWLWTGDEWVPAPPKAPPNAVENAIEEIEEIAEQNNISVQELKETATNFDLNQDQSLSQYELQLAAMSLTTPPKPLVPASPYISQNNFKDNSYKNKKRIQFAISTVIILLLAGTSYWILSPSTSPLEGIKDSDGDGFEDSVDLFPESPVEWYDSDGDGVGDNADLDDDNDGYSDLDEQENCGPFSYSITSNLSTPPDFDGDKTCDFIDLDDDNDGYNDDIDLFPFDSSEWNDYDSDGIGDNADQDDDGDGVLDVNDFNDLADVGLSLTIDTFKVITQMDYFDDYTELYICVYLDSVSIGCGPDTGSQYWSLQTDVLYGPMGMEIYSNVNETQQFHWLQLCAWDSDAFDDDRIDIDPSADYDCLSELIDISDELNTNNSFSGTGVGDNAGWDGEISATYQLIDMRFQRFNTFEWDYDGKDFSIDLQLDYSIYSQHRIMDHSAGGVYQPETYGKFSTPSEQYVIDIALDLKNMAESNGYTTSLEIAEFIYAFVGDIQYVLDIDGSGESEYPKYPIEMLWEASGDCEDAAILYISLIEAVNYDAMIVTGFVKQSSDEDWGGHAWAVVSIPGEDNLGTYWYGDGAKSQTKFYFVETTAYYDGTSHIGRDPWYDIDDESYYDVE
jgi:hypothetical protein